jgi:RHS repeat-associated protein
VKVGEAHTEYHAPALPAVYDYYPFGMLMPDRYTSDTSSECVTVSQTKWVTTWVTHCYLAADWVWPAYSYYGSVSVSTSSGLQIAASESSGIYFEMDVLPYEQQDVYLQTDAFYSGSGILELQEYHGGQWMTLGSTTFDKLGEVRISIRPREDRIRAVLRGPFYVQVKQFCVQRPQLSQETVLVDICDTDGDKYRFGFNGQEKVNEWSGVGNFLDYKERGQETRIARFVSRDKLASKFPMLSPYQFASNTPIQAVDLDGNEGVLTQISIWRNSSGEEQTSMTTEYDVQTYAREYGETGALTITRDLDRGTTMMFFQPEIVITGTPLDKRTLLQKGDDFVNSLGTSVGTSMQNSAFGKSFSRFDSKMKSADEVGVRFKLAYQDANNSFNFSAGLRSTSENNAGFQLKLGGQSKVSGVASNKSSSSGFKFKMQLGFYLKGGQDGMLLKGGMGGQPLTLGQLKTSLSEYRKSSVGPVSYEKTSDGTEEVSIDIGKGASKPGNASIEAGVKGKSEVEYSSPMISFSH